MAWQALRATNISAPGTYETRQGYLSKDEFFVLLSELQLRLGVSDNAFSNTFGNTPPTPRARRNPFNRKSMIELLTPPQSPIRAPPIPPKVFEYCEVTRRGPPIDIHIEEIGSSDVGSREAQSVADGYSEYIRSFGSSALGRSSSSTSSSCEWLLPVEAPKFTKDAETSRSSDKEVVPVHWTPTLPKIIDEEMEEEATLVSPVAANAPRERESIDRSYVELEVVPSRTRWDPDDFGTVPSLGSNGALNETIPEQTQFGSAVVFPRPQQEYTPLSTAFSNQLAIQRISSLVASEPQMQRKGSRRNIGAALQVVRKKTIHFKSKPPPPDPDKAASGYLYTKLAEALQDAVAEGNISLVASLFNLGADVNYSSVKNQVYHNILQVAVASGHAEIVEFFIAMGADGISVDNALVTAFFADRLDLAIKLTPHASIYHLRPFDNSGPEYQKLSASSLGRVIRDRTMPAQSRLRLLRFFYHPGVFRCQQNRLPSIRYGEFALIRTLDFGYPCGPA